MNNFTKVQEPLLSIKDLCINTEKVKVIEDLSLNIMPGEMLGLVGESGSGKSVTALSIMRLLAEPPMRVVKGRIMFSGKDITNLTEIELQKLRGEDIAMIFQEPMTSLNPVFTIGDQICEMVLLHRKISKTDANVRAKALLSRVGIPSPETALQRYPHQLSGGQRQRVMIAIALACEPRLLIADEPTTALDVTVQAQILGLIEDLRREKKMAVLLITHDLGVVSQYCDRVAVMYSGRIVELAASGDFFSAPRHRYTEALLQTAPSANTPGSSLPTIGGTVPDPRHRPGGCSYHTRCEFTLPHCSTEVPLLKGKNHQTACWNQVK